MEMYNTNEVIEKLGISRPTIAIWLRDGKIKPSRRVGKRWYFDKEYIENYGRIESEVPNETD
jgi:excisionase family DNA binding protein